jgi:hypothetical protein
MSNLPSPGRPLGPVESGTVPEAGNVIPGSFSVPLVPSSSSSSSSSGGLIQTLGISGGAAPVPLTSSFAAVATQSVTVAAGQKIIVTAANTVEDTATGGGTATVYAAVDGAQIGGQQGINVPSAGQNSGPVAAESGGLSAGAHTVTIQAKQLGGSGSLSSLSLSGVIQVVSV